MNEGGGVVVIGGVVEEGGGVATVCVVVGGEEVVAVGSVMEVLVRAPNPKLYGYRRSSMVVELVL